MAMWELAPGSPWYAIFRFLVLGPGINRSAICQYPAGGLEIGRCIDAAGDCAVDGYVDPHAGLQRPELLQLFLALERRWRKLDETLQCRAAIGIEADVMVARTVAERRRRTREVQRAQPPRTDRRAD